MTTQKPTVGRIVLFDGEGGPYPAIVTKVKDDGSLELCTFGPNSVYFQHGVREAPGIVVGVNLSDPPRTWTWPPREPT